MNKPIKRVKGRYILEKPIEGPHLADEAWVVVYMETDQGKWEYGFRLHRENLVEECGYSLRCASEILRNYWAPTTLRIIDTETGEIVNPVEETVEVPPAPSKVVQEDLFGNEYMWE